VNGARGLLIATAAAFIVGCSVGLMGGILFMRFAGPGSHRVFMKGERHGGPPPFARRGGPGPPEGMLRMMGRELDLSQDQHDRILQQIDRAGQQHRAVRESMHVWIERELTPEQRERWKRMEERFERSRRGSRSRGPRSHDRQ
jgi:hypothetical protein